MGASNSSELFPEIELPFHADLAMAEGDDALPPYFASEWPAGRALARFVLDSVEVVAARVLDFGTGAGIVALAAARAGAREVVGVDRDRRAIECLRRNAETLGLAVVAVVADPVAEPLSFGPFEVVLAGDVLYDTVRERVWPWLVEQAMGGARVLVADCGRIPAPLPGMRPIWETRMRGDTICTVFEIDVALLGDDARGTRDVSA